MQMAESKKRERSANFSPKEIELLIKCVDDNKHVIKCKKTDATTWKDKNSAWERVEETLNGNSSDGYRSQKNLKSKYEDIKKSVKKKLANNKMEIFKTGGAEAKTQPLLSIEESVLAMLPSTIKGNPPLWDSDTQRATCTEMPPQEIMDNAETNEDAEIDIYSQYEALNMEFASDEDKATVVALETDTLPVRKKRKLATTGVPLLQTAVSPELCVKVKQPRNNTKASREDMLSTKNKNTTELHEMRLKILQKEYEIKENQLYAEMEIREEQLKAAKIETEIKELQKKILEVELKKN